MLSTWDSSNPSISDPLKKWVKMGEVTSYLLYSLPEDYISQADFRIAEPYDDFNEDDSNKFWEIEAETKTYNI